MAESNSCAAQSIGLKPRQQETRTSDVFSLSLAPVRQQRQGILRDFGPPAQQLFF